MWLALGGCIHTFTSGIKLSCVLLIFKAANVFNKVIEVYLLYNTTEKIKEMRLNAKSSIQLALPKIPIISKNPNDLGKLYGTIKNRKQKQI
jgi:hypothetical protein